MDILTLDTDLTKKIKDDGEGVETLNRGRISGLSNLPIITTGDGVPSSTPSKAGDIYVDITNGNIYIAKGSTNSADWVQVNN